MVVVATDIPMVVGGSSEPAYTMSITALPPEIAATKNKRSAHLLQQFMQESLNISSKRGVVRYEAVLESNLATNGMTALQEMELLDGQAQDGVGGFRSLSRTKSRSKRSSQQTSTDHERGLRSALRSATPSTLQPSAAGSTIPKPVGPSETRKWRMKSRKSIFGNFKKRSIEALKE